MYGFLYMSNEKTSELTPGSVRSQKLISRIEDGEIKLPEFQRGYVWKQNQVIELLDSINYNYPIGSVLLWEADKEDRLKTSRNIAGINLPNKPDNYPVKYCLDGQQRISTIFGVFWDCAEPENKDDTYNPDENVFEIYYDIQKKCFVSTNDVDKKEPSRFFYMRNLLNAKKFNKWCRDNVDCDDIFDELSELQSRFQDYEIPIVEIKKRNKSEVGVIFERINNTGTKLSPLDLMTAWTWDESFHLRDKIKDLLSSLKQKNFDRIDDMTILQITSAIIKDSTSTSEILSLDNKEVKENWQLITESIKKSVDFLSGTLNCKSVRFLPFKHSIAGFSYFFFFCKKPTPDQLDSMKSWFWASSFNQKYTGGRTTSKMDHDISIMKMIIKGDLYKNIPNEGLLIKENTLINTQFSIKNPLTRAFLLLQAQRNPMDLVTSEHTDIDKALSSYNRAEYHHVFPNAFLSRLHYKKEEIFSLINFCFLTSKSNKIISSKEPKDYFKNEIDSKKFSAIMRSNLLPEDRDTYNHNNYRNFQTKREKLVLSYLKELID